MRATTLLMQKDERRFESLFVLEAFPLLCVCLHDGTVDSVTILQAEGHTAGFSSVHTEIYNYCPLGPVYFKYMNCDS